MAAVRSVTALRRLLALNEFAESVAGARAAQELLDDLAVAHALAADGVGTELAPDIEAAAEAIRRALSGPQPMGLTSTAVQELGGLIAAMDQQERLASPAQRFGAQVVLAARRRGWVGPG